MKITSKNKPNQPINMGLQHQILSKPLEKKVLHKKNSLLDLKSLLEDRGGTIEDTEECDRATYVNDIACDNRLYRLDNKVSFETTLSDCGDREWCKRRYGKGSWCCRIKTLIFLLLVAIFVDTRLQAEARSSGECRFIPYLSNVVRAIYKYLQDICDSFISTSIRD